MAEYIEREALIKALEADFNTDWNGYSKVFQNVNYVNGVRDEYDDVLKIICQQKTTDVQSIDEITKIIQARLNGVQKVKIDAMLSGDNTTAYKMVGAETVCIAILQDLEAIKGQRRG